MIPSMLTKKSPGPVNVVGGTLHAAGVIAVGLRTPLSRPPLLGIQSEMGAVAPLGEWTSVRSFPEIVHELPAVAPEGIGESPGTRDSSPVSATGRQSDTPVLPCGASCPKPPATKTSPDSSRTAA